MTLFSSDDRCRRSMLGALAVGMLLVATVVFEPRTGAVAHAELLGRLPDAIDDDR